MAQEQVAQTQTNPLCLGEVMRDVLKFLTNEELLSSRLVCHLWNHESGLLLAHRFTICIHHFKDKDRMEKLCHFVTNHDNFPFRSFEFHRISLRLISGSVARNFFKSCGHVLHHITFTFDIDDNYLYCPEDLWRMLRYYTPNVESLTFRQMPESFSINRKTIIRHQQHPTEEISDQEDDEQKPIESLKKLKSLTMNCFPYPQQFLQRLISSCWTLQKLVINFYTEPLHFKNVLLPVLFSCQNQLQHLNTFKYFLHDAGVGTTWSTEEIERLAKMKIQFKSLKLHSGLSSSARPHHQQESVYHLLLNCQLTLERLKLRVHHPLLCPMMSCLKTLILYDYEGPLSFLDQLPSLTFLGLCEYVPAKDVTPENILPKQPHSLISLNMYSSFISTHFLQLIALTFPNLRILHLWHVNNDKLSIIIEKFSLLEELTINIVDCNDEAITGISIETCEQIERLQNFSEDYLSPLINEEDRTTVKRVRPSISEMKNLRYLEIHGARFTEWQWTKISDVSFVLGIAHLPALTSLALYDFKWITDISLRELADITKTLDRLAVDLRLFSPEIISYVKDTRPELKLRSTCHTMITANM